MLNPQDIYCGLSKQTHIHRKEDDLQGFLACKPEARHSRQGQQFIELLYFVFILI